MRNRESFNEHKITNEGTVSYQIEMNREKVKSSEAVL